VRVGSLPGWVSSSCSSSLRLISVLRMAGVTPPATPRSECKSHSSLSGVRSTSPAAFHQICRWFLGSGWYTALPSFTRSAKFVGLVSNTSACRARPPLQAVRGWARLGAVLRRAPAAMGDAPSRPLAGSDVWARRLPGELTEMPNFRGYLAFPPSGWGLASDSGTIARLELLW
jgi:hypothetical protein